VNTIQPGDTLLDSRRRGLPELVRSSVHYYNSEDEVVRLVEAVAALSPR
jgi:selenocysteine lyase/cysteine desulfurase